MSTYELVSFSIDDASAIQVRCHPKTPSQLKGIVTYIDELLTREFPDEPEKVDDTVRIGFNHPEPVTGHDEYEGIELPYAMEAPDGKEED